MSKIGIELYMSTDRLEEFIKDLNVLLEKHDVEPIIDTKNGIISFDVLDLINLETTPIHQDYCEKIVNDVLREHGVI